MPRRWGRGIAICWWSGDYQSQDTAPSIGSRVPRIAMPIPPAIFNVLRMPLLRSDGPARSRVMVVDGAQAGASRSFDRLNGLGPSSRSNGPSFGHRA